MTGCLSLPHAPIGVRYRYHAEQKLHGRVWTARPLSLVPFTQLTPSALGCKQVVLKYAPRMTHLKREKEILQQFAGDPSIRQLVDYGASAPFLALEYLDVDALQMSRRRRLPRQEIKLIARSILSALDSLHARGIAHTDIKPDNILLNYNRTSPKFDPNEPGIVEAKLADCGDACTVGPETDPRGTARVIGAAIFRSPEALLGLRWSIPTDIWSFGATLISLLWGRDFHIFKTPGVPADDPEIRTHVLIQQARYFGPFPLSYATYLDEEQETILAAIHVHIEQQNMRKPFELFEDDEVTLEDKKFICDIMKLDPVERPTAKALLKHAWFDAP